MRRAHIGIYVGIQAVLSSKSNTSSSINRSAYSAAGQRVQSTPTSSFKSVYKQLLRRGAIGSNHQRFIEEQQTIISKLIRDFSPDCEVFYTIFDTPNIVHEDALADILGVQHVIYEIIFNQRGTVYEFYIRNLPEGNFSRL